jgi:hypothetical protein
LCISAPVDISTLLNLPPNLSSLYGRPTVSRRIEKDKKIVLYVLAADDSYQVERGILQKLQKSLQEIYQSKGFEIHMADLHVSDNYSKTNIFDLINWLEGPLEAQCGHHLAANCLAEITSNLLVLLNWHHKNRRNELLVPSKKRVFLPFASRALNLELFQIFLASKLLAKIKNVSIQTLTHITQFV